ncbi:hypothetical protein HYFRA_00004578 [Hymenoscyphus fraxineus]|uniref:CRAL-TRIO domain-containing protein n=1 Tax=Hymenoscyphus fraxineus TaxID=746836 RepID=A0A9N9L077_9HELO|nr:hypothetical protein HYFRA_00004578 [Hymenoscyphus fraxineus]
MSTAGPAHRVQSAVVEYGYPQGHLGHLGTEEEAAFKNFKALCAEKGYYTAGETADQNSHDDETLLRFLRARRFIVADAFAQFKDTEDWRKANQITQLYETIDLEHYEETRRLYPQWTGRRDRRGIPVYVFEVKHLHHKAMAAYEKSAQKTHTKAQTDGKTSQKMLRLFALYENLVQFVLPLCSQLTDRENAKTPITQSNNIVDISGVGLKQFWNLRTHMQDASTLATAHYPETLDRIFVCFFWPCSCARHGRCSAYTPKILCWKFWKNCLGYSSPERQSRKTVAKSLNGSGNQDDCSKLVATLSSLLGCTRNNDHILCASELWERYGLSIIGAPAFFPTVWGWIKKWFDPITTSKIFILSSHDMKKTLESFIDPKNIPKKYGGELEFQFGDMPLLDPAMANITTWENGKTDLAHGPMIWKKEGEYLRAVAVGSESEGLKVRRENICLVKRPVFEPEPEAVVVPQEDGILEIPTDAPILRPELLTAPTETDLPSTITLTGPPTEAAKAEKEQKVPGDGPAVLDGTKPVDAAAVGDVLKQLSLDEKKEGLVNGSVTATAPVVTEGKTS